ncbi:hypothetical protein [Streptomyces sp. NPDC088775]|uniref:hypothetical protein n=1 Tax=Streptomyces sp. NPDC088775 TaxID=3365896 RepID=UPI003813EF88
MTTALRKTRRGIGRDWTTADYDSYTVLTELGHRRPAARVRRARRGRPLRRAFRAALRTATATTAPRALAVVGRGLAR